MVTKLTSRSTDSPSGTIVNQVQNDYNDFGQLAAQYQSHSGVVVVGTTPKVAYAYANGAANHIRPTSLTYPYGTSPTRVLNYNYGSAGSDADNLSRVVALVDNDGTTHLADYTYLGLGMVAKVSSPQPNVRMDLAFGAGSDPYDGLDRFDRIQDLLWRNNSTSVDIVRIKHGYDKAGNRLWREDPVAAANSKNFDELYTYDAVYRLASFKRGDLNASKNGINTGTLTFQHDWTFDPLGNWTTFTEDADGIGGPDFTQTRTFNKANELLTISGGGWFSPPTHDRNGNMTTMPQPALLTTSYTATYDAWNRLVKLASGGSTVVTYKYDGQNWRTTTIIASPAETREHYYSSVWQFLEERVGGSSSADRQFVWGLRYIDDLVLRDRGAERFYALQDPNWNVVALANTAGIQERYAYTAYGTTKVLDSIFGNRTSSLVTWEIRYAGYRWDAASSLLHVRRRDLHSPLGR
jgi:YD repeat-containing protein